jgi:predicted amino acid racemase
MNRYPRLKIDLDKITENTRIISNLAGESGMSIFGVTKATSGDPEVGEAMLRGGAVGLADSRIENIRKLGESIIDCPKMLLRTPMPSEVEDVVRFADISLNSEKKILEALSKEAQKQNRRHKIIIMVEMGDLREGEMVHNLEPMLDLASGLEGLDLYGIGMNLACFAGVVPTHEKIETFEKIVIEQERRMKMRFEMVTGGNSGNIPVLLNQKRMGRIDHLRIGEAILLGLETVNREPVPGTYQDAFEVEAEIIEAKIKPSVPNGRITQNAFGETPEFEELGDVKRIVIALGIQDTIPEDLSPLDASIELFGGSSDHMVMHDKEDKYNVGDIIRFIPSYGALVGLITSKYVKKVHLRSGR